MASYCKSESRFAEMRHRSHRCWQQHCVPILECDRVHRGMSLLFSICNRTLQKLMTLCEKLEARRLAPRSWKSMRSKSVTMTKTYSKHSRNRLLVFENRHFKVDGLPGATTQCSGVHTVWLIYYRESHSGRLVWKTSKFWRFFWSRGPETSLQVFSAVTNIALGDL